LHVLLSRSAGGYSAGGGRGPPDTSQLFHTSSSQLPFFVRSPPLLPPSPPLSLPPSSFSLSPPSVHPLSLLHSFLPTTTFLTLHHGGAASSSIRMRCKSCVGGSSVVCCLCRGRSFGGGPRATTACYLGSTCPLSSLHFTSLHFTSLHFPQRRCCLISNSHGM